MANVICLLCLRTDITAVKIASELSYFVEELCDYNDLENSRYKYCTICAHLLKKFYNFKQQCLKACKILKSLKRRSKILPTNLHEQMPLSLGLSNSLANYMLAEHRYQTAPDLSQAKPDLKIESNITNNVEVNSKQNIRNIKPNLTVYIEVKEEPMQAITVSDIETMQIANVDIYDITNGGSLTLQSNFEEQTNSIKSEANKKKFNTNGTNKVASKDNARQSEINFLRSSEKDVQDFEGIDVDDMDIKDTVFMSDKNLKEDESYNSMDNMEIDICDEQNAGSDTDSLPVVIEVNKKLNVKETEDLKLGEVLLKIDKRNKLLKKRVKILRAKANFKDEILKLFEDDEYDLGDGLKISKKVFLKIYERSEKSCYNIKDVSDKNKTADFLRALYKMYNPDYETVFDIEYLDTEEKKLQEFNRRKDRAEYQNAPYQCARCYKGFQLEWLHASHMKKHDESSGPQQCHICSVRFSSASTRRAHGVHCHSTVYTCRLCHITFYYFTSMLNHFNLHKGVQFPCPICNGIYRTKSGLANHRRTHVTSNICTTCAKSFVSAQGLLNHKRLKHKQDVAEGAGQGGVSCVKCPLTLVSQEVYEKHMRISHRTLRYICRCKRSFPSMAELRRHKVEAGHQHTYKKPENNGPSVREKTRAPREKAVPRTCPICKEMIPNRNYKSALSKHYAERHPGEPYLADRPAPRCHLCDQCGKKFTAYSVLQDHKNTHSGALPYQCPECPRAFATAPNHRRHLGRHRPPAHQCKLCGKLFKASSNLSFHMRIHKNDRRYKCDVCAASFLYNGALKEHIRGVHQKQRRVKKKKET